MAILRILFTQLFYFRKKGCVKVIIEVKLITAIFLTFFFVVKIKPEAYKK